MLFSGNRKVSEVKDFWNSNSIMAIYQTPHMRTLGYKDEKDSLCAQRIYSRGEHISMTTQPDRTRQEVPWELKEWHLTDEGEGGKGAT